ncbi:MAG: class I SAM-dependent methyltransferase [Limisphaerales bacterium]
MLERSAVRRRSAQWIRRHTLDDGLEKVCFYERDGQMSALQEGKKGVSVPGRDGHPRWAHPRQGATGTPSGQIRLERADALTISSIAIRQMTIGSSPEWPNPPKQRRQSIWFNMSILSSVGRKLVSLTTYGQPERVLQALRSARLEWRIARAWPSWAKRLQLLADKRALKLNLGCGNNPKPGWVNIDLFSPHADFRYDVRRSFPLRDNSCAYIYSEHLFEHLEYADGLALMRESHRLLEPGGIFRAAVPDMPAIFSAYLAKDYAYFDLLRDFSLIQGLDNRNATSVDYVNFSVYQFGEHRIVYDEEKLAKMSGLSGFSRSGKTEYLPEVDSSTPMRRKYSFYFEAIKCTGACLLGS